MGTTVRLENVTKRYRVHRRRASLLADLFARKPSEQRLVINNIDLEIPAGAKVLVLGPNGAGKSTLLRLIAGLARPDEGRVMVGGKSASFRGPVPVGLMIGTELLYPALTGRQNLELAASLLGLEAARERAEEAAAGWALWRWKDDPVEQYPTGRRALLALARATLANPPLLLLDEPAAHLDAGHRELMTTFLETHAATVFVTHPGSHPLPGPFTKTVHL